MSTLANILTFSRAQSQSDSNGLTDTNGIIYANEALVDFHRRLTAGGIDASQTQEAYTDGAAGTGTYLYPGDLLFLKAIEANFVNTNARDYKRATQVDVSNLPDGMSFSYLREYADRNEPYFDDRGDQFEIFPTPKSSDNTSQMFRIFYFLKPTEYTATSDTISYPISLDYRILGWRIVSDYLMSLGKFEEAQAFNNKYEERIVQLIATLGRGSQQPLTSTPIQMTGFEF
jgi:hypothetical protein